MQTFKTDYPIQIPKISFISQKTNLKSHLDFDVHFNYLIKNINDNYIWLAVSPFWFILYEFIIQANNVFKYFI